MSIYAKIITDDKRFERMLSLELEDRGLLIIDDVKTDADSVSKKNFYTLVDLDFCMEDDLSDISSYSNVIAFSHTYRDVDDSCTKLCYAVLHRPFLMEELFSIIFGEKKPLKKKRNHPIKLTGRQINDNKEHLRIDHTSKKAVWGNEGIALSENEYKLLSLLCERRGDVVIRSEIDDLLGAGDSNISDVYICMLRKKIDNRLGVKLIYTVRGEGYKLKN